MPPGEDPFSAECDLILGRAAVKQQKAGESKTDKEGGANCVGSSKIKGNGGEDGCGKKGFAGESKEKMEWASGTADKGGGEGGMKSLQAQRPWWDEEEGEVEGTPGREQKQLAGKDGLQHSSGSDSTHDPHPAASQTAVSQGQFESVPASTMLAKLSGSLLDETISIKESAAGGEGSVEDEDFFVPGRIVDAEVNTVHLLGAALSRTDLVGLGVGLVRPHLDDPRLQSREGCAVALYILRARRPRVCRAKPRTLNPKPKKRTP